jgi:hypothetical protein
LLAIILPRQARTRQQLDQALADYRDHVMTLHPALRRNAAFNLALERKQYFHALCDIRRASRGLFGSHFQDIIHVLEQAANQQFILDDRQAFPDGE